MLDIIIIVCLVKGLMLKSLFGKSFQELSQQDMEKLQKNYNNKYRSFVNRGAQPPVTLEQYLPMLQKTGKNFFIAIAVLVPIYLIFVIALIAMMASEM